MDMLHPKDPEKWSILGNIDKNDIMDIDRQYLKILIQRDKINMKIDIESR